MAPNYLTKFHVNQIILDDVIDQAIEISTNMELSDIKVPKTFEEADSSIHKQHWRESMVTGHVRAQSEELQLVQGIIHHEVSVARSMHVRRVLHVIVMHLLFYFIPTRTPYSDSVTHRSEREHILHA